MLFALDKLGKRVHIDETVLGETYFCPVCNKTVIVKKGEIRQHHFAHQGMIDERSSGERCILYSYSREMSDWHVEWQNRFNKQDIEVLVQDGEKKHIADVIINNTVLEFQHSSISIEDFRNRNEFYTKLGYNVIWIFDFIDDFNDNKICQVNEFKYEWMNRNKLFRTIELKIEKCSIYFQLTNNKIIRIINEYDNFRYFYTNRDNVYTIDTLLNILSTNIEILTIFLETRTDIASKYKLEKGDNKSYQVKRIDNDIMFNTKSDIHNSTNIKNNIQIGDNCSDCSKKLELYCELDGDKQIYVCVHCGCVKYVGKTINKNNKYKNREE